MVLQKITCSTKGKLTKVCCSCAKPVKSNEVCRCQKLGVDPDQFVPVAKLNQSQKSQLCDRLERMKNNSKLLEGILDISHTIIKIMISCGIHSCKANRAIDTIIYTFLHFDEVIEQPSGHCKKQMRKAEFLNDIRRETCMSKGNAKLTYGIVKCAFKAFYFKQVVNRYDDTFCDECVWMEAARKTIEAFKKEEYIQPDELCRLSKKINCAYITYFERRRQKMIDDNRDYECCTNVDPDIVQPFTDPNPCTEYVREECTCAEEPKRDECQEELCALKKQLKALQDELDHMKELERLRQPPPSQPCVPSTEQVYTLDPLLAEDGPEAEMNANVWPDLVFTFRVTKNGRECNVEMKGFKFPESLTIGRVTVSENGGDSIGYNCTHCGCG